MNPLDGQEAMWCWKGVTYFLKGDLIGTVGRIGVLQNLQEKHKAAPFPQQNVLMIYSAIDLNFEPLIGVMALFAVAFAVYEVDEEKAAESY